MRRELLEWSSFIRSYNHSRHSISMSEESTLPEGYKFCECGCKEVIRIINKMGRPARFKHGHNGRGRNNGGWKGGRWVNPNGYVLLNGYHNHPRNNNGRVFEHILVMEKHIGRYLRPEEVVHHINGNRSDNRIENLELFESHSEHMKLEKTGTKLSEETKKKVGLFHKGRKRSKETRMRMVLAHRARKNNQ